jgi:hypothetical protein
MLSGQLKMIPIGMCYIWKIEGDVSLPIFGDAASLLPTGRRFPRRPVSLYSAKMKICVLTSGGVDSAVLLGRSLETSLTVYPLYIRCGLAWEKAELHWLRRLLQALHRPSLRPLTVLDVPVKPLYEGHWSLTGPSFLIARSGLLRTPRPIGGLAGHLEGQPFPRCLP